MVAMKIPQNIDLTATYQLLNALLHKIPGDPSTPVEGQFWYDQTGKKFKYRTDVATKDPLARADHTGTQLASTISDLAAVVQAYRLDQFAAPTAALNHGGQRATNAADAVSATDLATLQQVQALLASATAGLTWKKPVRASTTANIANLATGAPNATDGVTLAAQDRVIVRFQSTPAQNGIYTVQTVGTGANGVWVRASDADVAAELEGGVLVAVDEGTLYGNTVWMLVTDVTTLGTDAVTWTQFGAGSAYTASLGVQLVGSDFRANLGAGLTLSGNQIVPDYTAVQRKKTWVGNVPSGTADAVVNHAFGLANKYDLVGKVYEQSTGAEVLVPFVPQDVNNVVISFGAAPTAAQYYVALQGLS
jgi:hypothetical protein